MIHTHTHNERINLCIVAGCDSVCLQCVQRFVDVTTDYVSDHSIYFNLTAEVLNWTSATCRKENGRFSVIWSSIQCRNMQNHQQMHELMAIFLQLWMPNDDRMRAVESFRTIQFLRRHITWCHCYDSFATVGPNFHRLAMRTFEFAVWWKNVNFMQMTW